MLSTDSTDSCPTLERLDINTISALQMISREAFDAMRAYHISEIEHKRDTINILRTALTVILTIYGASFAVIIYNRVEVWLVFIFVTIVTLCVISGLGRIVWLTNRKIESDGERYDVFKDEWARVNEALGVYEDINTGSFTGKLRNKPVDSGVSGGRYQTIKIVRGFYLTICGFSIFGWALFLYYLFPNKFIFVRDYMISIMP